MLGVVRKLAQLVQQVIVCALVVLPLAAIEERLLLLDALEHHLVSKTKSGRR